MTNPPKKHTIRTKLGLPISKYKNPLEHLENLDDLTYLSDIG